MIVVNQLKKAYEDTVACDLEHLEIKVGEHIGLLGNNGAGKTTLISLMLDLIKPDSGTITIDGMDIVKNEEWKYKVSAYLDEGFLIDFLKPEEYFDFIGKARKIDVTAYIDRLKSYEEFFRGEIFGNKRYIRDLSKGNKKKVGVTGALATHSDILLLDEPFANLDPSSQIMLKKMINEMDDQTTKIISSHDLTHIIDVCTRIIIIESGKIVKDLAVEENTLAEIQSFFGDNMSENEI